MVRKFTKDVGEHFIKGDVRDYTKTTWDQIAKSAKKSLSSISEPIDTHHNAARSRKGR